MLSAAQADRCQGAKHVCIEKMLMQALLTNTQTDSHQLVTVTLKLRNVLLNVVLKSYAACCYQLR